MNSKAIKQLANENGWRFVGQWQDQPILEFKKMADKVLINYDKGRVTTILYHEKFKSRFGATRLMREGVTEEMLRAIFKNPRVHTDKGRYLINH